MKSDRIFGLSVFVVALFYIWSATTIQIGFLSDPVGSRTFPYLIGGVAAICAVVIILRPDGNPDWPNLVIWIKLVAAIFVMFLFAQMLKPYGFIIPAAIASASLSYLISPNLKLAALAGVGLSVGLFLVFRTALGLSLSAFGGIFG